MLPSSQAHVRDSVAQIDANTWLIGTQNIIQKLQHDETPCENRPNQRCMWRNDSDGAYYMLYPAPFRLPKVSPLPAASSDSHVRQIHDAGDVSAVFKFGHSLILKVKIRSTSEQEETAVLTKPYEHETLAFLSEQQFSFKVPRVLFHAQEGNKTFLLEPCMPGQTVNEAWWTMTPAEKDGVTTRVAAIVNELTAFRADIFTSGAADYDWIDPWREDEDKIRTLGPLKEHCEALGMDCSAYILSHNDLGPTNWIRTKFAICGVMAAERVLKKGDGSLSVEIDHQYRKMIEQKLGEMGFPEVIDAYNKLHDLREEEWKKRRPWLR
ncbi:hypothetical protein MCOR29_003913 [Pyricularia oryzae]|uniref:Aminoglycoside phosphotransferase domain-containing protein n=1 Tax=Pyricularia grisea TaxID=148305 RepID=A0ABQ8NW85_PYRGI|nr:hypothetical protein MCOR19_005852 [Pyricularia oryzae]KAI6302924.1 hypothetical protein MCOR33_001834 [Pyricularia grisea]KAI6325071.1 hypothetical protein MCOR29_003913 [Pyricularia oryzae]KAI6349809.1 hypothetical protein MCOR28_000590 [Pyricularia oryzae]KAI6499361.1 hypothetical protein MCOR11_003489 [Pyricularia oryzae]